MKLLRELLEGCNAESIVGNTIIPIVSMHYNSNDVAESSLFVAMSGVENNGHNFISSAILQKKIVLNSNGESFRPLIHVNDIVRAIVWACQRDKIKGGDFLAINIGCNEWNFKIIDLAKIVSKTLGNIPLQFGSDPSIDPRSYKFDFSLFKKFIV